MPAAFSSSKKAFSREKEADLDEMVVHLNRLQYFVEISKRSSRDQGKLLELEVKLAMPEYLVIPPLCVRANDLTGWLSRIRDSSGFLWHSLAVD